MWAPLRVSPMLRTMTAVLLDIEGTCTTAISFLVYDVLFPYASAALEGYLRSHSDEPTLQPTLAAVLADGTPAEETRIGRASRGRGDCRGSSPNARGTSRPVVSSNCKVCSGAMAMNPVRSKAMCMPMCRSR